MTQRQKPIRTTMYSVETIVKKGVERQEIVTHSLPWPKDSPKFEPLKARGFTLERPDVRVEMPLISKEDAPGVVLMSPTTQDKRVASLEKARAAKVAKKGKIDANLRV